MESDWKRYFELNGEVRISIWSSLRRKVGPTSSIVLNQIPQLLFKISGSEQRVVLDQNRSSEANLAVRIFIWARLPRRLTKVNFSSYKNLQNRKTGLKPKRTTRRPNSQCQQVINDLGSLQECSIRGKEFFNLKMTWRVIIISTTKRTFVRERKDQEVPEGSNKPGNCSRISCSVSQVASSTGRCLQRTLTTGMALERNLLTSLARMATGSSTNVKLSSNSTASY